MYRTGLLPRSIFAFLILLAMLVFGYPAAFIATHGVDPAGWPSVPGTPQAWFSPKGANLGETTMVFVQRLGRTYTNMMLGRSEGLPGGGRVALAGIVTGAAVAIVIVLMSGKLVPLRHRSKRYGDAKWAAPQDLARMRKGLE